MNREGPFIVATIDAVKKAVRYWQIASMVVEEGGEAHTINLCQQCYNEQLERSAGEESASSRRVWKVMGNEQFTRGVWEYFTLEGCRNKRRILADASRGNARRDTRSVATGISFLRGSGATQKKCGYCLWHPNDAARLPCNEERSVGKNSKTRYRNEEKPSDWTLIAPCRLEWEESLCRVSYRIATVFLSRATFGGYRLDTETASTARSTAGGGVRYVDGKYEWRAPKRILVVQLGINANEAKVFKVHAAPQGLCGTF